MGIPFRVTSVSATFRDSLDEEIDGYESIHHRNENIVGPGDMPVWVKWANKQLGHEGEWFFSARMGVVIPSGGIEPNPFQLGKDGNPHQHIFYGRGTWDPQAGFELNWLGKGWGLSQWLNTRASLYENKYSYQGGLRVNYGIGVYSALGLTKWQFVFQPDLFYETPAKWYGTPSINSGQTSINIGIGANRTFGSALSLYSKVKWPFHIHREGDQLNIPLIASLGLIYGFNRK